MRNLALLVALGVTLAGCSTVKGTSPPPCDGKPRRPANLYGSVLDPSAPPQPEPAAKPEKGSAAEPSFRSCLGWPAYES